MSAERNSSLRKNGKRRDSRGRVLRSGESERRSDNLYCYRYKDIRGKRKSVYASDLRKLREKEAVIEKSMQDNIDYAAGNVRLIDLVERYISLKQGVRYNTRVGYEYVLNILKKEDFGYRKIRSIKMSDAKLWLIKLHNDGRGYSTLTSIKGVLRPAFRMAYQEDVVRKNPFDFAITSVVPNDSKKREALTPVETALWMSFIRNDKTYSKYYDEFVVLIGTGMRVSEFCGLTKKDLDFKNRKIRIDHQLERDRHGRYYIVMTKTSAGRRFIPMTNEVYDALENILKKRPKLKTEMLIDGYSGFILFDKKLQPKVALHIENECRLAMKKYNKLYPDKPINKVTPHVYRHTFCTNMVNAGIDLKSLQYLMGHSDVKVTLDVYSHINYERAAAEMIRLIDGKEQAVTENRKLLDEKKICEA